MTGVEVRIEICEGPADPVQLAAWRWLWRRLLSDPKRPQISLASPECQAITGGYRPRPCPVIRTRKIRRKAMRFKASTYEAQLKPGVYEGMLDEVEERAGEHGSYLVWTFVFDQADGKRVDVRALSSAKFGPQAKARGYVEALLGRKLRAGEEIDTADLIGRPCQAVVTISYLDDGSSRNSIERLMALGDNASDEESF